MFNIIQALLKSEPMPSQMPTEGMDYLDPQCIAGYYEKAMLDPTYSPLEALYEQTMAMEQSSDNSNQNASSQSAAAANNNSYNKYDTFSKTIVTGDKVLDGAGASEELTAVKHSEMKEDHSLFDSIATTAVIDSVMNSKEAFFAFEELSSSALSFGSHVGSYKNRPRPSYWPENLVKKYRKL